MNARQAAALALLGLLLTNGTSAKSASSPTDVTPPPPAPEMPFPDADSEALYNTVWAIRPVLMRIPHVTDVEGNLDTNDNYIIAVEVDKAANLPAVQAQIPPKISGFSVEFGADDEPIYLDPEF